MVMKCSKLSFIHHNEIHKIGVTFGLQKGNIEAQTPMHLLQPFLFLAYKNTSCMLNINEIHNLHGNNLSIASNLHVNKYKE